ncbi:MAG: arginase family protein [Candidatus Sulfotelmatobacter sp.]
MRSSPWMRGAPQVGFSATIRGVRDLDRAEEEHLKRSSVQLVKWYEGLPQTDVRVALDNLTRRVREIYLHIDMDSLDPRFAPGVMFDPVPGGLSLEDVEQAIRDIFARFRVRAAALTVYTPDRDQADTTLKSGLRIIELLAEGVRAQEN